MSSGELPVRNSKLVFMASFIESVVPSYDIKQSDPVQAATEGIGNCVAKAAIAGVLLERTGFMGDIIPALAWNTHTHPKKMEDLIGRVTLGNGHAMLLATNNVQPYVISCLAFNPMRTASSNWEVEDFNNTDEHAAVVDGAITATPRGQAAGFVIADWHEGGRRYMEALGDFESSYHHTPRAEMTRVIIDSLVERDVMSDFTVG